MVVFQQPEALAVFPDLNPADLPADGLVKLGDELDDPRIFVRRRHPLHMLLQFGGKFVARGIFFRQFDAFVVLPAIMGSIPMHFRHLFNKYQSLDFSKPLRYRSDNRIGASGARGILGRMEALTQMHK